MKRDVRLGTWNVRSLYRSDSLTAAASRELARYKLDLEGVQEVKWDKGGRVRAHGKEKKNHQLETAFFVHHRIVRAFKRVVSVSDRMSHIVLRGCWCCIIVLNVHAPSEEKSDASKGRFYDKLEQVFNYFPKYCMKIL